MKTKTIPNLSHFKEKVYKDIGKLQSSDELKNMTNSTRNSSGCFGLLLQSVFTFYLPRVRKWEREYYKIDELNKKADIILADKEIMQEVCLKLDKFEHIDIDVAYKITPVLYERAIKNQDKIPLDSMLFAVIIKKIVDKGVVNYCE